MILAQDASALAAALELAGWGASILALVHRQRWIGLSLNSLLPIAQLDSEFIRVRLLSQSGAGTVPGELTVGLVLFGLLPAGFVAAQRRGLFALLTRPLARLARGPAWRALAGGAALDAEMALAAALLDRAREVLHGLSGRVAWAYVDRMGQTSDST